jgi:hypothetical protein
LWLAVAVLVVALLALQMVAAVAVLVVCFQEQQVYFLGLLIQLLLALEALIVPKVRIRLV